MAKESVIQASFSAGELSPHLHDRVDLEAYYAGCAELENFIPLPHGPILRRRGSRFIAQAADVNARLIPFTFNIQQSFVLEFTPEKIRVFYEDGILLGTDGTPLVITSPYRAEDLPNLNWAQQGDWLYLTDGYHTPRALKRYSNTNWVVEELVFKEAPPEWVGTNQPKFVALFEQRAYYAATTKQPQQLWASRTGIYEDFTMFDMVGEAATGRILGDTTGTAGTDKTLGGTITGSLTSKADGTMSGSLEGSIIAVNEDGTSFVLCSKLSGTISVRANGAVTGSISGTIDSSQNYSTNGTFTCEVSGGVEGTITGTFANKVSGLPPTLTKMLTGSITGTVNTVEVGDKTILDDHAFSYTIFSNDTNGIEWLLAMGALIIGTAGAEFKMGSTSAIDPVTPKNVRISVQTHYGSASVRPLRIGSSVIFIQRSKNRIRSFEYSFAEDQYTAQDLTIFASHILMGRVRDMQVQSAPDSYVWLVTETGQLIGCTYEKAQKVLAWHRHTTTNGKFTSLCILPTQGNDRLYVSVERDINGVKRTFIEVLIDSWEPADIAEDAFYVDSGLTYEGEPVSNLVGLQHLEGCTVSALVDGWVHPDVVVKNGGVKLQSPGSKIHIGLRYKSHFLSLVPQSQQRITLGSVRRISEATIALEDSADFFYKAATEVHVEVAYDGPTKVMNKAVPLTSRHHTINIMGKSEKTAQLQLWQDRPLPLIIRGIVYTINPSSL